MEAVPINISAAEVLEIIYDDTNPNLIYGIKVKPLDLTPSGDASSPSAVTAKPINSNILRVPIVGEVVLLLKAPSSYSTGIRNTTDTYYIDIVGLQSSIHHNALPTISARDTTSGAASGNSTNYSQAAAGNTNTESTPTIDSNFTENENVKPLQHYIGDVMFVGRYGNSIRFSTTPKSGKFKVQPNWTGGSDKAPISIYRNTIQEKSTGKTNDFTTEDFTKDDNIIVQASGQSITFEQASKTLKSAQSYNITSWQTENWGKTPQTLISSGRIVFNSSQKEIIAFAKAGIALSSETSITIDAKDTVSINAKKMELGTNADEPLVLGNKWSDWTKNFFTTLGSITPISPTGPCSPLTSTPQWAQIEALKAQLPTILSGIAFTKKQ